jgi:hypothetical protein
MTPMRPFHDDDAARRCVAVVAIVGGDWSIR